jgi:hypothetical protein
MYDDVKDPLWPDIETYNDFLHLSKDIIEECLHKHGLGHRLDQLSDPNYWIQQSPLITVYTNGHVAYLPIPKCASKSYIKLFHNDLGWTQSSLIDINMQTTKVFALVINPMTRRLKGLVQNLVQCYGNNYEDVLAQMRDERFLNLLAGISITDHHTLPYFTIYKPWIDLIYWIPIDEYDADTEIRTFLRQQKIHVDFPNSARINRSDSVKQLIFERLKNYLLHRESFAELYYMFAEDMNFYKKILSDYA